MSSAPILTHTTLHNTVQIVCVCDMVLITTSYKVSQMTEFIRYNHARLSLLLVV